MCDTLSITARVGDEQDKLSPYQKFHDKAPFLRLLPFLTPGLHRVQRTWKSEAKAQ